MEKIDKYCKVRYHIFIMAKYKYTDNSQGLFLSVNLNEQLLFGTFEWAINYLFDKIDLSMFDKNYKNDDIGAAAYPPNILLKIILYCYSTGTITSRQIEKACINNIIVKALARNEEPDHSTISTFVSGNEECIKDLFTKVLLQCDELQLIKGEMFSEDGCKIPSNASKEWSGKIRELTKKRDKLRKRISDLITQHKELDKDEEAKKKLASFRQTMGEDKERRANTIARLEKNLKKLDDFLEKAEPKIGHSTEEVKTNITDNESAFIPGPHGHIQGYNGVAIADSVNQIIVVAETTGSVSESGIFPHTLDILNENMKLLTGKKEPLKKALLSADTGFFSENNLQEAARRGIDVLIPDPQFRQRDPYYAEKKNEKVESKKRFTAEDFKYDEATDSFTCPAGTKLEYKSNVTLRNNSGKQYRAKSVLCSQCPLLEKCIAVRKEKVSSDKGKKTKKRNPVRTLYVVDKKYQNNLSEEMRKKIDNPVNRELYSKRMQIIEPIFSNITYCKKMNRFTMRGKKKANIQWLLYCIVHNLGKCMLKLRENPKLMGK